ncbi:MAG: glycogen debranching protein [Chloroflexi bacterium]|nr:MAG: glycogen debranching protein [Chloroflexota bacterium]
MDPNTLSIARKKAEQILIVNGSDLGLLGSSQAYRQVWARESMICGFGLWLCEDEYTRQVHRNSLETLQKHQSPLGKIPHNVGLPNIPDPALLTHGGQLDIMGKETGPVEDTIHAGCIDSNLLYIIGFYHDYMLRKDTEFLRSSWPSLERAFVWLRYQDSNECGLLEVHEAMDWADLFANRYNVLFDNVLYFAAWKCMGLLAESQGLQAKEYFERAQDVRRKINALLWVGPEQKTDFDWLRQERKEWIYPRRRVETELVERPFYLPYMAFRDYADRFDSLGNLIAILFGVANRTQASKILDYINACGLNEPFPVRAVYPPVLPGEKDWRDYYRVRNLNLPNQYHNGGAWPFIGGFYVAALVEAGRLEEAKQQLDSLTTMVRTGRHGEWEFNEWFHGISGKPMGYAGQSWSAAMYLFALDAVEHGEVRVFTPSNGWER